MPWWITWINEKGSPELSGSYPSPFSAQKAADKLDTQCEVVKLDTTNEGAATRMLKAKRIEELGLEGTRRFSHSKVSQT